VCVVMCVALCVVVHTYKEVVCVWLNVFGYVCGYVYL
jgi:hypothetical protein